MQRPLDQHSALVFTMMLISAAEGDMVDTESDSIGRIVRDLPVFHDFDVERLPEVWRQCSQLLYDLLRQDDGADVACEMIAEGLDQKLRETAYLLAFEVAAADRSIAPEERNLLEILRQRLNVDRLAAAAIEHATYVRHAVL
jgi:tellurite resistance protein